MWHTSCKCRGDLLGKFDNKIIDKLACKLSKELRNLTGLTGGKYEFSQI